MIIFWIAALLAFVVVCILTVAYWNEVKEMLSDIFAFFVVLLCLPIALIYLIIGKSFEIAINDKRYSIGRSKTK